MASKIAVPLEMGRTEWKSAETECHIPCPSMKVGSTNVIIATVEKIEAGTVPAEISILRQAGEFRLSGGEAKPSKNVFVNWIVFSEEEV